MIGLIRKKEKKMKKTLLFILCLIILCGCQQKSDSQEDKQPEATNITVILEDDQTLKPGQQFDDADAYLQDYETLETESSAVFYSNDDIEIFVGMDGSVKKITLFTDTYQLDNDIKVGSSKKQVLQAYQNDKVTQDNSSLIYHIDAIDITLSLTENKVTKIELQK